MGVSLRGSKYRFVIGRAKAERLRMHEMAPRIGAKFSKFGVAEGIQGSVSLGRRNRQLILLDSGAPSKRPIAVTGGNQ